MYIVYNSDECEQYEFTSELAAREKLVRLCSQGISAYMVFERQYLKFSFINKQLA